MAKISSDKAKPNGVLYVLPGQEQSFLAPLDVGKIPGVGKVTKARLNDIGIVYIGDLLKVEERVLEDNFGKWGPTLAGKARGEDAGAWFEGEVGEEWQAKSISHEHTFDRDTADLGKIEPTLAHLSEKVGRRLREQNFIARTLQLKLRYSDFTTITRAHSLSSPRRWRQKFSWLSKNSSMPTGRGDARFGCWACRPQTLKTCLRRWTCWKATRKRNGHALFPRLTGCAINMATQQFSWPRPWAAVSASESMKIRRRSPIKSDNAFLNS